MLGGAFVVEVIFAWPGVGRTVVEAVFARDFPGGAGRRAVHLDPVRRLEPSGRSQLRSDRSADPPCADRRRPATAVLAAARPRISLGPGGDPAGGPDRRDWRRDLAPFDPEWARSGRGLQTAVLAGGRQRSSIRSAPTISVATSSAGSSPAPMSRCSSAFYAIVFSGGLGGLIGMISGYFGGIVDATIMRLVDIQMSIPSLALALVLAAVLEPGPVHRHRRHRGQLLDLVRAHHPRRDPVVERTRLRRARPRRRLQHASRSSPAICCPTSSTRSWCWRRCKSARSSSSRPASASSDSGIQSPDVSWGLMLADARGYITNAWWAITMPGIAIMLTCLASNLMGDWLRDSLDPRRRQR